MRVAIFGFGSLMSPASVIRSGISVESVKESYIEGFQRSWSEPFSKGGAVFSALGLREHETSSIVYGSTIFISDASAEKILEREKNYRHLLVPAIDRYGNIDRSITFETRNETDDKNPIPLSYVATVLSGFISVYGARRIRDFFETTHGWEKGVFNDASNPIYDRAPEDFRDVVDEIYPILEEYTNIK